MINILGLVKNAIARLVLMRLGVVVIPLNFNPTPGSGCNEHRNAKPTREPLKIGARAMRLLSCDNVVSPAMSFSPRRDPQPDLLLRRPEPYARAIGLEHCGMVRASYKRFEAP